MYLMPLKYTFKNVRMVNFVIPQFKKKKLWREKGRENIEVKSITFRLGRPGF